MSKLIHIVLALAIAGCATDHYIVTDSPPAAREEVVATRPGFIWVHGHWAQEGTWKWKPGYYTPERPGEVYIEGHWEHRGGEYIWVTGNWRGHNGVVIRDPAPAPDDVGQITP